MGCLGAGRGGRGGGCHGGLCPLQPCHPEYDLVATLVCKAVLIWRTGVANAILAAWKTHPIDDCMNAIAHSLQQQDAALAKELLIRLPPSHRQHIF